jgi:regulator of protease activity HflC (stomatin/prohibitin superfamily)
MLLCSQDPLDSLALFGSITTDKVPLVLIPDDRNCASLWFFVPSGVYAIEHECGAKRQDAEFAPAGKNWKLSCTRVAYCVARQACTYSAPVRQCPTFDNVMIDVNLKLVFQIGPEGAMVHDFVYKLGASRFDEFLYASVQEAIRTLIRSSYHSEVRQLFGSDHAGVKATLDGLNKQFNRFGVRFSSAVITDAIFSDPEFADTLQQTSEFASKVNEHKEAQSFRIKSVRFLLSRDLRKIEAEHTREVQALIHEEHVLEAERSKVLEELKEARRVAIAKAKQDAEAKLIVAEAEAALAKGKAEKEMQSVLSKGLDRSRVTKEKQEIENEYLASQAEREAAEREARALMTEAQAWATAAVACKSERQHQLNIRKHAVLKKLASSGRIVVSGTHGDRLINGMVGQFSSSTLSSPKK